MMTSSSLAWLLILLALVAANLPFFTERLFFVRRLAQGKSLAWRLAEMLLAYLVVGLIAMALEQYLGKNAPQGWEFYAITGALFITLAFPGFVYRYLYKRH